MAVLTKMGSDSLLPAYSPAGAEIAFTSYLRNNPDLWIVVGGRRPRAPRLEAAGPEHGRGLVARRARPRAHPVVRGELRALPDQPGRRARAGAPHPTTRRSTARPSFSPDGSQIAFVSNRQGSPQIFVMPAGGGGAKRVTFQGKYNQTPRWSPRTDKPQIAFTGRDERGVFDVFILDVKTGRIDRVTAGQGLEPRPDLVARRAPARLRLQPRRHLRQQPRDPPRGPGLEGRRVRPPPGVPRPRALERSRKARGARGMPDDVRRRRPAACARRL